MNFEKAGYKFSLIDDPMQKHVVAWELAMRAANSEEPKEMLRDISLTLASIKVTERGTDVLFSTLQGISKLITDALRVLSENETATLSSHRSRILKAAIKSGWVLSFEKQGESILDMDIDDNPPWVVQWMASEVAGIYNQTQAIPPN